MTFDEANFPARDRLNSRLIREARVTGPVSYTAGGDPILAPANLGMAEVFGVYGTLGSGTDVLIPVLDYTNQTIRFYLDSSGVEVAGGANISTFVGTLLFTGKG